MSSVERYEWLYERSGRDGMGDADIPKEGSDIKGRKINPIQSCQKETSVDVCTSFISNSFIFLSYHMAGEGG